MMCLHKYGLVKVTSMQPVKREEHIKVDWLSHFKQTQFYRSEPHTVLMERSPYCFPSQWSVHGDNSLSIRCSFCTPLMHMECLLLLFSGGNVNCKASQ